MRNVGAPIAVVYSYIYRSAGYRDYNEKVKQKKAYKDFSVCCFTVYTYFLNKSYQAVRNTAPNEIKETLIIEEIKEIYL